MKYHRYNDRIEVNVGNNKNIKIIANKDVDIQKNSLKQLEQLDSQLMQLSSKNETIELDYVGTPDFHKGSVIPIGTTVVSNYFIPKLMGNDINCGMQLLTTSLTNDKINNNVLERLTILNRSDYFEGRRGVWTDSRLRKNIIEYGIQALHFIGNYSKEYDNNIWQIFSKIQLLPKQEYPKRVSIENTNIFDDWINNSCEYDSQLGSIGGGNHFCEYLYVDEIFDNKSAQNLEIKSGQIVILVHSGSLGFGHAVNILIEDTLKEFWSKSKSKLPPILGLPPTEKQLIIKLFNHIKQASNFASVNRTILSAIAFRNLSKATQNNIIGSLITDSSHNMIDIYNSKFRHRKGACSANKDEIVLIPGSMGTSSYICLGNGNEETLNVSSHGSGRSYSRGEAMKKSKEEFNKWMSSYPIVTPLDFTKITNSTTKQLKKQQLMQESPVAYKDIEPTINSQVSSNMITKVARLKSLMTIKAI